MEQNIRVAPDSEFPVTFHSVLFERIDGRLNQETLKTPAFWVDLNLDQVIDAITAGREEYNLKPLFYASLNDTEAIHYRQEIFRDLETPTLLEQIKSFAQKIRAMREHLAQAEKRYYQYQKKSWFLDAVEIYGEAVNCLGQDLSRIDLKSQGLLAFRAYLTDYIHSERFTSLLAETKKLKADLLTIKYALLLKGNSIQVRKYAVETDYSAEVEATFDKFKQGAVKDYRIKFHEFPEMNHVEAKILDLIAQWYPDIFANLDNYYQKNSHYLDETIAIFDREIQFYLAYLEFIARFKRKGLPFCYPQVSQTSKAIYDYEGFDLALANKLFNENSSVICNDFYLKDKERIFVVSGPNQGGKTTFARTFGQLHYLASLGCPVPGREAQIYLYDRLFTHFEKEENIQDLRGKLEDDLVRIYDILSQATSHSIIIINEILVSTTLKDAVFLSQEIMEIINQLDALCVWVTFIEELASFSEKTVSLVSTVVPENPTQRTFKIVRMPADGRSYAIAIAEKYHLTYQSLKERIQKVPPYRRLTEEVPSIMKAYLLYKDHNFDLQQKLPWNEAALTQDLELDRLFGAMARGDKLVFDVVRHAILSGLDNDLDTILYRQHILEDCLNNPSLVREFYALAVEAVESRKKSWLGGVFVSKYPASILSSSIELLQIFIEGLKKFRTFADKQANKFKSEGFTALFAMLQRELSDEYFTNIQNHLQELKFGNGVLISAELGKGFKGTDYVLRKLPEKKQSWRERLFGNKKNAYTFFIGERDEAGANALSELNDRGIHLVANAVAQSADHILSFFNLLRTELAFYIGCLNLQERLAQMGEPMTLPLAVASRERCLHFYGLYDVCLALRMEHQVVGNDVKADNKNLVIITGANQGGKSTFLRSLGLAQLMLQCGMFVPAESFCANIGDGLFTHFKREEDVTLRSGKLDEELSRMSEIVEHLTPNSMLLFNESFAATNEREGSEIARQIVSALLEKGVQVFFVTHLYDFAHGLYDQRMENALFLRAERRADGTRTFKLIEGEPMETSYGEDLYHRIFGTVGKV